MAPFVPRTIYKNTSENAEFGTRTQVSSFQHKKPRIFGSLLKHILFINFIELIAISKIYKKISEVQMQLEKRLVSHLGGNTTSRKILKFHNKILNIDKY
jgi:hypothetical protein